jgi:hypothetical protein
VVLPKASYRQEVRAVAIAGFRTPKRAMSSSDAAQVSILLGSLCVYRTLRAKLQQDTEGTAESTHPFYCLVENKCEYEIKLITWLRPYHQAT